MKKRSLTRATPIACLVASFVVSLVASCASSPDVKKEDEAAAAQVVACDDGIVVACVDLAARAERGDGVPRDLERAAMLRERACTGGHAESCEWLANAKAAEGEAQATTAFLEKACREGDDASCVRAANVLFEGDAASAKVSAELFSLACERGSPHACTGQGMHLVTGRGLALDDERARTLFLRGCQGGDPQGCANLAFLLESGRGGFRDDDGAEAHYAKACDQEVAQACFNLGARRRRLATFEGDTEAALFFDRACAHGEGQGCARAAWHHAKGRGVPRDVVRARAFAERACALRVDEGCTMAAELDGGTGLR